MQYPYLVALASLAILLPALSYQSPVPVGEELLQSNKPLVGPIDTSKKGLAAAQAVRTEDALIKAADARRYVKNLSAEAELAENKLKAENEDRAKKGLPPLPALDATPTVPSFATPIPKGSSAAPAATPTASKTAKEDEDAFDDEDF